MKLILCRHGETDHNRPALCSGQSDVGLTPKDKAQAGLLALALERLKVQMIVSSDLRRVKETTQEMTKVLCCPVVYRTELRELDFGEYQGRPIKEYFTELARSSLKDDQFRPDGGERLADLRLRVMPVIYEVIASSLENNVAIVSHGTINRVILTVLLGGKPQDYNQASCSLNIIQVQTKDQIRALRINDTSHLALPI